MNSRTRPNSAGHNGGSFNRALAGRADLRDSQLQELLWLGQVGGVWHPLDLWDNQWVPVRAPVRLERL